MTRYYHCSSTSLGYFDLIVQCFLIVAFLLLLLLVAHRLCVSFSILFFFHCNAVSNSSHTFKFPAVCSLVFVSLLVAFVFCFFAVVVVALILLTCTVLRVAAADGARWKEQQAIVFFPCPFPSDRFVLQHLSSCRTFRSHRLVSFRSFSFFFFFLVFFACRMPVYDHHGQR